MSRSAQVDEYIGKFPRVIQVRLRKVRATIRANAPGATEFISYRIPAFKLHGVLVYFAGFKEHIGMFPPVRGNAALQKAAHKYAGPKGNLKFFHDQPLPLALIARIVRFRVREDRLKAAARKK
jgi:uncharacterized protein YdhG (YjbR/CyaY superfamily)